MILVATVDLHAVESLATVLATVLATPPARGPAASRRSREPPSGCRPTEGFSPKLFSPSPARGAVRQRRCKAFLPAKERFLATLNRSTEGKGERARKRWRGEDPGGLRRSLPRRPPEPRGAHARQRGAGTAPAGQQRRPEAPALPRRLRVPRRAPVEAVGEAPPGAAPRGGALGVFDLLPPPTRGRFLAVATWASPLTSGLPGTVASTVASA